MSNSSKVSATQIIDSISNLLTYSTSIHNLITTIETNKKTIKNKCESLEEYNNCKLANTTKLTFLTDGYKEQYKICIIKGQTEKLENIKGLDRIINDLTNLTEQLNNLLYDAINRAIEIEGFINELEIMLANDSINPLVSKIVDKYTKNSKNLTFPEAEHNGFTVQGITEIDGNYFVTAYKEGMKSRIYIYDTKTRYLKGEIILNNSAHVGGISYDEQNKIMYVTGSKGTVNAYNYNLIKFQLENNSTKILNFNEMDVNDIIISNNVSVKGNNTNDLGTVSTKVGAAATVFYKGNQLYVGTFDGVNEGDLVCYNLKYNKDEFGIITSITAEVNNVSKIPKQTQGVAIANYNGKEYLITTQSLSDTPSQITMYEKNGDKLTYIGKDTNYSCGLEGVTVDNGNITMCYENNKDVDTTSISIEDLYQNCISNSDVNIVTETIKIVKGHKYNQKHGIN